MSFQPFLPRGMQHVDRDKLYSSLPIRVQYLQQFLDFGPGKALPFSTQTKDQRLSPR